MQESTESPGASGHCNMFSRHGATSHGQSNQLPNRVRRRPPFQIIVSSESLLRRPLGEGGTRVAKQPWAGTYPMLALSIVEGRFRQSSLLELRTLRESRIRAVRVADVVRGWLRTPDVVVSDAMQEPVGDVGPDASCCVCVDGVYARVLFR